MEHDYADQIIDYADAIITEESFDEVVDESNSPWPTIEGILIRPSEALKMCDPVAYNEAKHNYEDSLQRDGFFLFECPVCGEKLEHYEGIEYDECCEECQIVLNDKRGITCH